MYQSMLHIVETCRINVCHHYSDVIMSEMGSKTTGVSIVYSTVCSYVDQRKHQSSASLAFVRGIHLWPVNSPHKGPVTRKSFHVMTSSCYSEIARELWPLKSLDCLFKSLFIAGGFPSQRDSNSDLWCFFCCQSELTVEHTHDFPVNRDAMTAMTSP